MNHLQEYCRTFFDGLAISLHNTGDEAFHRQDKRCLQVCLDRFLKSGLKRDAFNVYFCFCEIFRVFGGGYSENAKVFLEVLFDYEQNAGVLADKQRDHFSHAVYVFAIGIAVYERNKSFRTIFESRFGKGRETFLYRFGLAALFHDIGYPFEIAFTGIRSFLRELNGDAPLCPFMEYGELDGFLRVEESALQAVNRALSAEYRDIGDLLAARLAVIFPKYSVEELRALVRPADPRAKKHIDHGYFSAVLFLKKFLGGELSREKLIAGIDSAAAIFVHNGFARYILSDRYAGETISPQMCPLGFLLLFCDAVQDYGRTCYGRFNKKELYAVECEFEITDNGISLDYIFGDEGIEYVSEFKRGIRGSIGFLELSPLFEHISIAVSVKNRYAPPRQELSPVFFRNVLTIANKIHENYTAGQHASKTQEKFDSLPLEHKLSNILQAESYEDTLQSLNCFYDHRDLPYLLKTDFSGDNLGRIAEREHGRWMREKIEMGWSAGEPKTREEREEKRIHPCLVPFEKLKSEERQKDEAVFYGMIKNLRELGFKIYSNEFKSNLKKTFFVGITGHIRLTDAEGARLKLGAALKKILREKGDVLLLCCMADGADLMCAEIAQTLGIPIKAVLPKPEKEYREEIADQETFSRILRSCVKVVVAPAFGENDYQNAGKYVVDNSDLLLAVWDGKPTDKLGGTYDTIRLAKEAGIDIVYC